MNSILHNIKNNGKITRAINENTKLLPLKFSPSTEQ